MYNIERRSESRKQRAESGEQRAGSREQRAFYVYEPRRIFHFPNNKEK
jgi:hypothetical protein